MHATEDEYFFYFLEDIDDGPREGLPDSDGEQQPLATPAEKYFHGLLKGRQFSRSNVNIIEVPGRGRGAVAARDFRAGDFVCEYAACVKTRQDSLGNGDDRRYQSLQLGCYALDACHEGQWYTFDATGTINDPGRYINHASRGINLSLMKPVCIDGQLRIGFVAKSHIKMGEELFYDYGVRDKEIPWLISNAKAMAKAKPQPKKNRLKLRCPIKGCPSQQSKKEGFVKLSQHLMDYHRVEDKAQRQKLCADARQVCIP